MLNRISHTKILAITGIILCFIPATVTPIMVMAQERDNSSVMLFPNNAKVYRIILYKKGTLSGSYDENQYKVALKADKEYFFSVKFSAESVGLYNIQTNPPGEVWGIGGDFGTWELGDPASIKKLSFTCIPDVDGEHTFVVSCGSICGGGTYQIYFNRVGFAGYWWMIAAGVGALAILIIIIIGIAALIKPKKKKRRRRR
ncbi:MAG: hypothetical protein ACFFDI_27220 [Promethearchaeota archaeon]